LAILGNLICREPAVAGPPNRAFPPLVARQLGRALQGRLVLDRLDLTVAAGQIVALTGANGAGKTTLLRCLTGRLHPTAGEVLWFGQSPNHRPASHRLIGFAGHESLLYLELSARENLLFAARMHGLLHPRSSVDRVLATAELEKHAQQPAGHLSKGMRQRLSLARALIHEPPIVILDEPYSSLDVEGRHWLESWLKDLRAAHRAVVFSTHDAERAFQVADQTLDLKDGCLGRLHAFATGRAA
jgi:heme exporter protein A